MKLLPVIFLLLCSCVFYDQMATEFITMPEAPKVEIPEEIKQKQQKKQEGRLRRQRRKEQ